MAETTRGVGEAWDLGKVLDAFRKIAREASEREDAAASVPESEQRTVSSPTCADQA